MVYRTLTTRTLSATAMKALYDIVRARGFDEVEEEIGVTAHVLRRGLAGGMLSEANHKRLTKYSRGEKLHGAL